MTVYVTAPGLPMVLAVEEADRVAAAELVGDWIESGAALVFHDDSGSTLVVNFGRLTVVGVADERPADTDGLPQFSIDLRDLEAADMLDAARTAAHNEHDHHHDHDGAAHGH